MNRRDFIGVGALGAMGLSFADLLKMRARGETKEPKAKAVIQLWMGGGPTHLDTFDPKPEAGEEYCGPYKNPIQTNVPGIRICETLPLMAKQADKYSIIRSMVVGHNGHETATNIMQTGTMPSDLVYPATEGKAFDAMDSYQERAYGRIPGEARRAFDLREETEGLRDRYGRNHQGQSCLVARRLVERGVPLVTVNWGGWDTHRDNFGAMKRLLPPLDQAFSALLEDLDQRGLLESTIVTWFGEFGRSPKIDPKPPWDGGRHHHGNCMSAVVAGGGFKGGMVVGESDEKGELPKERPVRSWDLTASVCALLGIDPNGKLPKPHDCVAHATPPASGNMPSGGMLTEIM
ncbi:MAG: DUF1501 domain-containing protein [Planctomycetes bacterium]|nr:DUF1501 domain-containing protein [Planctomycetota bacterium]